MTERARSSQRRNRNRVAGADRPAAGASQTVAATSPPHMSLRPVAKAVLFLAFAFTIMADPVSSVAYTIEASLRALHGHLGLLMATQLIVLAIILLIDVNYWQLVARFPLGGGSAEAAARAFGTGWVFVPIGALIVDFILTITISVAAAVSALISYVPSLAPMRVSWPVLRPSPHIPVIGSIYLVCKLGARRRQPGTAYLLLSSKSGR